MRARPDNKKPDRLSRRRRYRVLAVWVTVVVATSGLRAQQAPLERSPWFADLRFESASAVEELLALQPPATGRPPAEAASTGADPREPAASWHGSLALSFNSGVDLEAPPDYVPDPDAHRSRWERVQGERPQAWRNLLHKEFFRHARRLFKRQWRTLFEDSVSMRYGFYRARMNEINALGRSCEEFDPFGTRQFADELRDDLLAVGSEGERELILFRYGPLQLSDEGSLRLEVPSILRLGEEGPLSFLRRSGRTQPVDSLYSGDWVRFRPGVKLRVDPLRIAGGDPSRALRSFGASLDTDFYSGILRKKLFSAELEATARPSGELGFVFNVIFENRG